MRRGGEEGEKGFANGILPTLSIEGGGVNRAVWPEAEEGGGQLEEG